MGYESTQVQLSGNNGFSFLAFTLLDEVGQVALAAIVSIEMHSHEDSRAAQLVRAFPTQPGDFVVRIHLVEFEHCEFDLLPLMFNFLWFGISLLLALLHPTLKISCQEHCRVVLDSAKAKLLHCIQ